MSWTVARMIGIVGIAVTLACAALAVVAGRRETRVRVGFDVARILVSAAAIGVMAWVADVSTATPLLVGGLAAGLLLGLRVGWSERVRVVDGRALARLSAWGLVIWASGVIASQVAALAAGVGALEVGQTISWFGVGASVGTVLGRHPRIEAARQRAGLTGAGSALLLVLFLGPSTSWVGGEQAGVTTSSGAAGTWTLVETIVNEDDEPTEFVSGVTPGYFGEPRFDGTFERITVSATSIRRERRSVDNGVEYWDMTTEVTLIGPPPVLVEGDVVSVRADGSASGPVLADWYPGDQFEFRASGVRLQGETSFVIGLGGRAPSSASVAPTFVVPSAASADAEIRIDAFLWNCGACDVTWAYRPDVTPVPTEPQIPVVPSDPRSTEPMPTDPMSTDPMSTDPFSTDPFSTDPFSTDSLSTDSLSTDVVVPGDDGGGVILPPVLPSDPTVPISAGVAIATILIGLIAAATIGLISITQVGVLISVLLGDLLGGLPRGGVPVGGTASEGPRRADDAATIPPVGPGPTGAGDGTGTGGAGGSTGSAGDTGATATSPAGPAPGAVVPRPPAFVTLTGDAARAVIEHGVGTIVEIPRPGTEDQRWDANVEFSGRHVWQGRRGEYGRVIRVETIAHLGDDVGVGVMVEPFDQPPPIKPDKDLPPPPPEPSPEKGPKDLPSPPPEPTPEKGPKDLPPPQPQGWLT